MKQHLLAFCLSTPWALRPETMAAYAALLAGRAELPAFVEVPLLPERRARAKADIRAMEDDGWEPPPPEPYAAIRSSTAGAGGAIAVIPVRGTIVQRAEMLDMCEGGTSTEDISRAVNMALADNTVSQILLHIHSPGGSVYGVQELGNELRAARKEKPIVAVADSLAASAAYWIGCSAGEFYMTPGGEVGSIGVWSAHQNLAEALKAKGIEIKLISAGKFKTEGHPYGPLPDEAAAFMQSRVDDYYTAFTEAVAKGRNVPIAQVRDGMGQGRVLGADAAMAEKMVDGVMTFGDVVKKMQRDQRERDRAAKPSRAQAALADIEILSL
jgi:signal peptide peptidase SppA